MNYEELLRIDEEIRSFETDENFHSLESKIIKIFSQQFSLEEFNKLVLFNKQINKYVDYIYNGSELFFSENILSKIANLKNLVYKKTQSFIDYHNDLKLFDQLFFQIKKYINTLDFLIEQSSELDLENYFKTTVIISEIKSELNNISFYCRKNDSSNSHKLIEYSEGVSDFINDEFEKKINYFSKYKTYLEKYDKSKLKSLSEKIKNEEIIYSLDDCIDLMTETIQS